jgi:hypothetical protein
MAPNPEAVGFGGIGKAQEGILEKRLLMRLQHLRQEKAVGMQRHLFDGELAPEVPGGEVHLCRQSGAGLIVGHGRREIR